MVHGQDQEISLRAKTQQVEPKKRSCREVEASHRVVSDQAPDFLVTISRRRLGEVGERKTPCRKRAHDLPWLTVYEPNGRSQTFMAADHLVGREEQRLVIDLRLDRDRQRQVVSWMLGVKLIDQPKALLLERQWERISLFG
jgi:hypothetical protein